MALTTQTLSAADNLFDLVEIAERAAMERTGIAREYALDSIRAILNDKKLSPYEKTRKLQRLTARLSHRRTLNVETVKVQGFVEALNDLQKLISALQQLHPSKAELSQAYVQEVKEFRKELLRAAIDGQPDDPAYDNWQPGGAPAAATATPAATRPRPAPSRPAAREERRPATRTRQTSSWVDDGIPVVDVVKKKEEPKPQPPEARMSWEQVSERANSALKNEQRGFIQRIDDAIRILKTYKEYNWDDERVDENLNKLYKAKIEALKE
jgi:hypothetical protein